MVDSLFLSGEGFSTGKSLLTDVCTLALYGKKIECTAPPSIPKLYDELAKGDPIYSEYTIGTAQQLPQLQQRNNYNSTSSQPKPQLTTIST